MRKAIFLLIILLSTTSIALATDVSVTANLESQTSSKLTYNIDVTEVNVDLMSFEITYDSSTLSLSSISAGSQLSASELDGNVNSGIVLIDIPGFDGRTLQGNIAIVELDLLDATGNRDIGVTNVDIISGSTSTTTINSVQGDTLASSGDEPQDQTTQPEDEPETSTEDESAEETPPEEESADTTTPGETTQKKTTTTKKSTTQQPASSDEEPESDNSILIYSLIAVGTLILIVGGFVAWNKFKKPKEEVPIHETTPMAQPQQPAQPTQPQQPTPQQPAPDQTQAQPTPQQPQTDQQPDQPTQQV